MNVLILEGILIRTVNKIQNGMLGQLKAIVFVYFFLNVVGSVLAQPAWFFP